MKNTYLILLFLMLSFLGAVAQPHGTPRDYSEPVEGSYMVKDFLFASGEKLDTLRLHYYTIGTPQKGMDGKVKNAVMLLHGTGSSARGFLGGGFAGLLFGPGQPLDASRYFIIIPDNIGHGQSSRPSDGMRMHFPKYNYDDMVKAQYLLLTAHLGVDHLRLILGTSMGAMHAAAVYAVNSADDEINPPELGIMEEQIKKVAKGHYILVPTSPQTAGHGTNSMPAVWNGYLKELLEKTGG